MPLDWLFIKTGSYHFTVYIKQNTNNKVTITTLNHHHKKVLGLVNIAADQKTFDLPLSVCTNEWYISWTRWVVSGDWRRSWISNIKKKWRTSNFNFMNYYIRLYIIQSNTLHFNKTGPCLSWKDQKIPKEYTYCSVIEIVNVLL